MKIEHITPILNVADIAPDGAAVQFGNRRCEIPPGARGLIRVLRIARVLDGADEDAPLFVGGERRSVRGK